MSRAAPRSQACPARAPSRYNNNQVLTLSNASGIFSGVISGGNSSTDLTIAGGTQELTGANTYTGTRPSSSGATLILSGTGSLATGSAISDSGTFNIRGTNSTGATTVIAGGALTGNGNLTSDVKNDGTVRPFDTVSGKAAALTINGTYTQGATGVFDIAIGGTTTGSYSQLHVTGNSQPR